MTVRSLRRWGLTRSARPEQVSSRLFQREETGTDKDRPAGFVP